MKKTSLFSCLLFCIGWLIPSPIFSQPEKICVLPSGGTTPNCTVTPPATPVNLNSNQAPLSLELTPAGKGSCTANGWYKAFWVFGDGNFLYFPTADYPRQEDSHIHAYNASIPVHVSSASGDLAGHSWTYIYRDAKTYRPTVYLTEKYSNLTEPPPGEHKVNSTGSGGTPSPETKTLFQDSAMYLMTQHDPRMDFSTVLVTSWQKNIDNDSKLVIFYNGKINADLTGPVTAEPAFNDETVTKSNLPEYYGTMTPVYGTVNSTNYPGYAAQFAHYVEYDGVGAAGAGMRPDFTEQRMFTIFKTKNLDATLQTKKMAFLAVLFDSKGNRIAQKYYYTRVVNAHDPNSLIVEKYEPAPGGKFKVYFKLTVCNDGIIPAVGLDLDIYQPLSAASIFENCTRYGSVGSGNFANVNPRLSKITFPSPFTIDAVAVHPAPYSTHCKEILFTMITDAAGIDQLKKDGPDERPIKACVTFHNAAFETHCSVNLPIPKDMPPIDPENCDIDWGDCWLWLILAGLVILGLIGIWIGKLTK